ncbi:OB-fold nucleic acid binding domain-containing protein, partial [Roseateles sp.]|uniref:OB-fold nucleic acid binding domain-containing protein n=1 Tax=Roseateles sp. TaxID=1971397 RepID=UPI0039E0C0F3
NADQGGLFDFDDSHAASTAEPDLVDAAPWSIKERLTLEKTAVGFYLSGHLFDQSGEEVRRMVKRRVANIEDAAQSREVVMLAGIVSDLRVINGNRGRVAIFKLDDKSDFIEAVASEELLNAHKELFVDDELLILQGKVQMDRFAGGYRFNVQAVWDLAGARARFGKYFYVPLRQVFLCAGAVQVAGAAGRYQAMAGQTRGGRTRQRARASLAGLEDAHPPFPAGRTGRGRVQDRAGRGQPFLAL